MTINNKKREKVLNEVYADTRSFLENVDWYKYEPEHMNDILRGLSFAILDQFADLYEKDIDPKSTAKVVLGWRINEWLEAHHPEESDKTIEEDESPKVLH